MKIICINELQTKHCTFRIGEEYRGNVVNEHWWVVEAVGVKGDEFEMYFKVE